MERSLLLSVLSSSFVAGIAGAFVGHWLANRREKKSRLQEQRIQYLVDAYRAFAKANHHPRLYEVAEYLEQAIADVQLLGSSELIALVHKFANDMGTRQAAELDDILVTIRKNLRAELGEHPVSGRFMWLRIDRSPKSDSDQAEN